MSLVGVIWMVDQVGDEFLQGHLVKELPKVPVVEGAGFGDNLGDDALAVLDGDRGGVLLQSSVLELLQGSPEAEGFKGRCECVSVVQHDEEETPPRLLDVVRLWGGVDNENIPIYSMDVRKRMWVHNGCIAVALFSPAES